jgi:hypothetical protein
MSTTLPAQDTTATSTPVQFPYLSVAGWTQLVGRLEAQHPDELARLHRGLDILRTKRILETEAGYLVESSIPGQFYRANTFACGCPDRLQRDVRCKHVWACTILHAASISARFEWLARVDAPIPFELTDKALALFDAPEPAPAA